MGVFSYQEEEGNGGGKTPKMDTRILGGFKNTRKRKKGEKTQPNEILLLLIFVTFFVSEVAFARFLLDSVRIQSPFPSIRPLIRHKLCKTISLNVGVPGASLRSEEAAAESNENPRTLLLSPLRRLMDSLGLSFPLNLPSDDRKVKC